MGLGPPVCLFCVKIMTLNAEYPYWTCSVCGKNGHEDEGTGFLFCVSDAVLTEMDTKWGTKELEYRQRFRAANP
jgi:hypothetical protein